MKVNKGVKLTSISPCLSPRSIVLEIVNYNKTFADQMLVAKDKSGPAVPLKHHINVSVIITYRQQLSMTCYSQRQVL